MDKLLPAPMVNAIPRGPVALVVGVAAVTQASALEFARQTIAKKLGVAEGETLLATVDAQVSQADLARDMLKKALAAAPRVTGLDAVERVRWAAVLDGSMTGDVEVHLSRASDLHPLRPNLIAVEPLSAALPPRSVPLYRLLGNIERADVVVTSAEFRRRRTLWRHALSNVKPLLGAGALVVAGFGTTGWLLQDLFAEMAAVGLVPRCILCTETDADSIAPIAASDFARSTQILAIRGTFAQLCDAIDEARSRRHAAPGAPPPMALAFSQFSDLFVEIRSTIDNTLPPDAVGLLRELLFSPSTLRWDPFAQHLDFPRSITTSFLSDVLETSKQVQTPHAVVLLGNAATGKTTLLKRAAMELADRGLLALWLQPVPYQDVAIHLAAAFRALAKGQTSDGPVYAFLDDPFAAGAASPRQVLLAARGAGLRLCLILAVRTSDWQTRHRDPALSDIPIALRHELLDALDNEEWTALPGYLQTLGIAGTMDEARTIVNGAESRGARDTLSMLYFLLPEAKRHIKAAIHDEYIRLGDASSFAQVIVGQTNQTVGWLRTAYEFAAVADHYRAPLPLEILVNALEITYADWLDGMTQSKGWGLLYSDESEDGATQTIRPRNAVITRLLVEFMNGTGQSRAAEVHRIGQLLSACKGSHPAYRQFCLKVLLHNPVLDSLDFAEGERLFTAAIDALPFPDKTLQHHLGIWVKDKGREHARAEAILLRALETPDFPYSQQPEQDEHINTSLAANALDAMNGGELNVNDGKAKILRYLDRARSDSYLNTNAVHVHAKLALRLIDHMGGVSSLDAIALLSDVLASLDRALATCSAGDNTTRDLLQGAKRNITARVKSVPQLQDEALQAWNEHRLQSGFSLCTRLMLSTALEQDRGKLYTRAYEYAMRSVALVEGAQANVDVDLCEAIAHLMYFWKVHVQPPRKPGDIDWSDLMRFLQPVLERRFSALSVYITGLAFCHSGNWSQGLALFARLRALRMNNDMLHQTRDYLRGADGNPKTVQGQVRLGSERAYLVIDGAGVDIPVGRHQKLGGDRALVRAFVEFSFAGPRALAQLSSR